MSYAFKLKSATYLLGSSGLRMVAWEIQLKASLAWRSPIISCYTSRLRKGQFYAKKIVTALKNIPFSTFLGSAHILSFMKSYNYIDKARDISRSTISQMSCIFHQGNVDHMIMQWYHLEGNNANVVPDHGGLVFVTWMQGYMSHCKCLLRKLNNKHCANVLYFMWKIFTFNHLILKATLVTQHQF